MAGILKEVWIDALLENLFKPTDWFMQGRDFSAFVNNNVINLQSAGARPNVLVNNQIYPVTVANRADTPIAIALDFYDTEATVVFNAEQVQLAYQKMPSVIYNHQMSLREKFADKAAYAWAPASDSTLTPVIQCTGTTINSRKTLSFADIAKLARKLTAANIPLTGRKLFIMPQGAEDLRDNDYATFNQVFNTIGDAPGRIYGFEIYWYNSAPVYDSTAALKAFGSTNNGTTDKDCLAQCIHNMEASFALGTLDMFTQLNHPLYKGDLISFQARFVASAMRSYGNGAIIQG